MHSNICYIKTLICLITVFIIILYDIVGPQYGGNSGKVLITVNVPHQDGMLPVVSTWQPSNFEFILSPDALRQGQHQCSNLIDFSESRSDFGFVSNRTKNPFMIGEIEPYQNSADLRTAKTLRFYRYCILLIRPG